MTAEWYCLDNQGVLGPFAASRMVELAKQGTVSPWTPVRSVHGDKSSPWRQAGEVKGLFDRDVSGQLSGPICGRCGTTLQGKRCPTCDGLEEKLETLTPVNVTRRPDDGWEQAVAAPGASIVVAAAPASASLAHYAEPIDSRIKYPHLHRYLGLLRVIALVLLGLTFLGVAIVIAFASVDGTRREIGATAFAGFCVAIFAYVCYLASMAGIELIRVVVDIETNTRRRGE